MSLEWLNIYVKKSTVTIVLNTNLLSEICSVVLGIENIIMTVTAQNMNFYFKIT